MQDLEKPVCRVQSDPIDVDAANALSSSQERKRRRVYMAGASSVVVLTLNATALHAKARASNRLAEACRAASHDPRAKGKARTTKQKPKGKSKGVQGAKHSNEKLRSS